jgi:hypothetical protein
VTKGAPGRVMVGFCYAQSTMTPQWARSYRAVLVRDAATRRRIVGEAAHEASGVHIPTARCEIVRTFLAHPARPEWLWIVDTDATFDDDVLERLIAAADRKARPIVGALAFGVRPVKDDRGAQVINSVGASPLELFPTLYVWDEHGSTCIYDYPVDQTVQVSATGAHCLLVHRDVVADPRWLDDSHPLPWFRTAVASSREVSEDQFFCLRAQSFGFPVHVSTAVKTGHVKTFVADEDLYRAQRGL